MRGTDLTLFMASLGTILLSGPDYDPSGPMIQFGPMAFMEWVTSIMRPGNNPGLTRRNDHVPSEATIWTIRVASDGTGIAVANQRLGRY
jgi:hypothetical protein